jgi:hypothetical protein
METVSSTTPLSTVVEPSRTLRRFGSFAEQEAATFSYWHNKSIADRMKATAELVRDGYRMRGIDVDAEGSKRSLVRTQRGGG